MVKEVVSRGEGRVGHFQFKPLLGLGYMTRLLLPVDFGLGSWPPHRGTSSQYMRYFVVKFQNDVERCPNRKVLLVASVARGPCVFGFKKLENGLDLNTGPQILR